jgi:hypothetical protein
VLSCQHTRGFYPLQHIEQYPCTTEGWALAKKPGGTAAFIVIIILGALIGAALGELIAYLFPGGILDRIFSRGISPGLDPPATLDLRIVSLTFGFVVRINLASLLGLVLGAYIYKQL